MSLVGRAVERASIDDATVRSMFRLFDRIYENVDEARFRLDLDEKRWVVLLEDGDDVRGFSTLVPIEIGRVRAIFSGDTVVDPAYWGEWELARTWGRFVLGLGADVWFLISKGYRTYRLLPLFFRDFWPRHDRPTPASERALIEALARARYPREFNAVTGVIEFAEPHGNLRPEYAGVPDHRADDPHVRFFVESNPGFARGNELACVASLSPENLTSIATRLSQKSQVTGRKS